MFSAGQIAGVRRPPPAEATGHGLPNGVEPLVNYIRNLRSGAANSDRENVAEVRSGARNEAPVQQPAQDGFLSPSLRPGINSNTVGDVEALWKQSVVYTSTISSPASKTHPLGVEIHLPEWLPPQLHDEYLRAWEKTVEEKLVYFQENPLTWLGIEGPLKKYKTFPDRKSLEQWFEIEAQGILPRFIRKTQELQAGECFVSAEEREIFHDAFGEPQFRLSAKWRDALHGADADLTPSSLESIERKTAEHQKFLEDTELMRRPDENVFEWNFRVQQVMTQRAFSKVAASFKLSGALGAVMSAGGAGSVGAAQKQGPELTDEEKAQTLTAAEELFAIQNAIGDLQAELRTALLTPQNISPLQVAAWAERAEVLNQRLTVFPANSQPRFFAPLLGMFPALRNHLLALRMNLDAWRDYPGEAESDGVLLDLMDAIGLTVEDNMGLGVETPAAPGAIDSLRQLIMESVWGRPENVQRQTDGSVLVTWKQGVSQGLSPFDVQAPKHQVRLANIGADIVRDEQTAEGWELTIRIHGQYRSPADALRNVWGEVAAVESSTQQGTGFAFTAAKAAFFDAQRAEDLSVKRGFYQLAAGKAGEAANAFARDGDFQSALKASELEAQALAAFAFAVDPHTSVDNRQVLMRFQQFSAQVLAELLSTNHAVVWQLGATPNETHARREFFANTALQLARIAPELAQIPDPTLREQVQTLFACLLLLVKSWEQRTQSKWWDHSYLEVFSGLVGSIDEVMRIDAQLKAWLSTSGKTVEEYFSEAQEDFLRGSREQRGARTSVRVPEVVNASSVRQVYNGDALPVLDRLSAAIAEVRKLDRAFMAGLAYDPAVETFAEWEMREQAAIGRSFEVLAKVFQKLQLLQDDAAEIHREIAAIPDAELRLALAEQFQMLQDMLSPLMLALRALRATGFNLPENYSAVNHSLDRAVPLLTAIEAGLSEIQAQVIAQVPEPAVNELAEKRARADQFEQEAIAAAAEGKIAQAQEKYQAAQQLFRELGDEARARRIAVRLRGLPKE